MLTLLVTLLAVSTVLAQDVATVVDHADPETALRTGLDEVASLVVDEEYAAAVARLDELLEQHASESYALLYRPRIEELARDARFLEGYVTPEPNELVSGELATYNPRSGKLRIRYTLETLQDFFSSTEQRSLGEGEVPDREDLLMLPAVFSRKYTVTVRGEEYRPHRPPFLVVVVEGGAFETYAVQLGRPGRDPVEASISLLWDPLTRIDRAHPPKLTREPFELEVEVNERAITASLDGERVLRGEKPTRELGRVGFLGLDESVTEIEIEGHVHRSWIRGLEDAHFHEALERAEEEEPLELPEPLRMSREAVEEDDFDLFTMLPGEDRPAQVDLLRIAGERAESDSREAALDYIGNLDPGETTEAFREYARFLVELESGEPKAARDHLERVVELDESYLPGWNMLANLTLFLEGFAARSGVYDSMLEANPDDERCYAIAAQSRLGGSGPGSAEAVLRRGIEAGLYGPRMDVANAMRLKVGAGPTWRERFEYRSARFHVVSDIDKRTCVEAAEILETALGHYTATLAPIPRDGKGRSPVFVFSGHSGYLRYTRDTTLVESENTLGVYYPALEQLLIWNTPDREEMLATIRHEGFHQYLDRVAGDEAPRWLQEGLAVYWEEADFTKTRSDQDVPPEQLLTELKFARPWFLPWQERIDPLRSLGGFDRRAYVQSWALIHFLMNDGSDTRNRLRLLIAELGDGRPAIEAQEAAFGDLDAEDFQARFDAYVADLIEGR